MQNLSNIYQQIKPAIVVISSYIVPSLVSNPMRPMGIVTASFVLKIRAKMNSLRVGRVSDHL